MNKSKIETLLAPRREEVTRVVEHPSDTYAQIEKLFSGHQSVSIELNENGESEALYVEVIFSNHHGLCWIQSSEIEIISRLLDVKFDSLEIDISYSDDITCTLRFV